KLAALDGVYRKNLGTLVLDTQEELPVLSLLLADRLLRGHIYSLAVRIVFVLARAVLNAEPAAGAVFRGDLNRILQTLELHLAVSALECLRSIGKLALV